MNKRHLVLAALLPILAACGGSDFTPLENLNAGWRTDGTGKYPEAKPPVTWSMKDNVVWKTAMPDFSNATPVLAGDKIYICSEPDTLLCLSKKDGRILWKKGSDFRELLTADEKKNEEEYRKKGEELIKERNALGRKSRGIRKKLKDDRNNRALKKEQKAVKEQQDKVKEELKTYQRFLTPDAHPVNGHTSPTPVCDGKRVYVNFGTGVTAAYTLDGERAWMVESEKPWHSWGHSASPVLADGKLIIYVKDVVALDAASGKEAWRFTPETEEREQPRWGSSVTAVIGGTTVLITPNGDFVQAADGKVLASRVAPLKYNAPLLEGGKVYFIQHKGKALELPTGISEPFTPKELWQTEPKNDRYYASPILYDGLIYAMTRKMDFSVIDAADGKVLLEEKLDLKKEGYPSLVLAGDYLYVSGDKGKTIVYKPGKKTEQVAVNDLETFRSTPVFEGKRMYIRAYKHMYCIGK